MGIRGADRRVVGNERRSIRAEGFSDPPGIRSFAYAVGNHAHVAQASAFDHLDGTPRDLHRFRRWLGDDHEAIHLAGFDTRQCPKARLEVGYDHTPAGFDLPEQLLG